MTIIALEFLGDIPDVCRTINRNQLSSKVLSITCDNQQHPIFKSDIVGEISYFSFICIVVLRFDDYPTLVYYCRKLNITEPTTEQWYDGVEWGWHGVRIE